MAKGKKGAKKGKKKAPKVDPNALTEVDKTFYELTITDLNRKLARLRSLTTELEDKNEVLQSDMSKLDEDRNDIIIYLKRMLQERSDEIAELQERLRALQETRQEETEQFKSKIVDLENEYRQMHEQLTSEIKLLEGKLNSLEEFRIQRDDLMKKFEEQEIKIEDQEKKHKNELYEIERKFIIGKDKLKKDMEVRLLQLSSEFQEATEIRIAATTHRVIRENIAINNELDSVIVTQQRLQTENSAMRERDRKYRQEAQLFEAERNKALARVRVQLNLINRLTIEHQEMSQKVSECEITEQTLHRTKEELKSTKQTNTCLNHKIRVLEQNVHGLKCRETTLQTELNNSELENERLSTILAQSVLCIQEVLELQTRISDEALKASKRENLLTHLFALLSEAEKKRGRTPSLDTIGSLSATYVRGDLGFVPKTLSRRSTLATLRNIEAQVGPSFEEFLAIGKEEEFVQSEISEISTVEESKSSEETVIEEESDVYFDEEEAVADESLLEFDDIESYDSDEKPRMSYKPAASSEKLHSEKSSSSLKRKDSKEAEQDKSLHRLESKVMSTERTSKILIKQDVSKEELTGTESGHSLKEGEAKAPERMSKGLLKTTHDAVSTEKLKRVSIGGTIGKTSSSKSKEKGLNRASQTGVSSESEATGSTSTLPDTE